jgi:hypothetical protein
MWITSIWRSGSRCERRTASGRALPAIAAALAAAIAVVVASAGSLAAQGAVIGQLRLAERGRAAPRDLDAAVVWLESSRRVVPVSSTSPTAGAIEMRGREFLPHVRIVRAGGAVAFPNRSTTTSSRTRR